MVVEACARRAAVLAIGVSACGTSLSSFQPAHVPDKGKLQGSLGVDISYPTGTFQKVVDAAEAVEEASEVRALSDDEKRTILQGGVAVGVDPPAAIPHFSLAYAPIELWEVGVKLAASGWRVSARRQLLEQAEAGVDFSIGLGLGRALFDPPVDSVLDRVTFDEFSRWNFDLPAALGRHGSWYRVWGGPRLLYSIVSHEAELGLPLENVTVTGTISARALYFGGHAGAALGYRSLFIGPELTLVGMVGGADVTALGETDRFDIESFIVHPSFAVMGEF